MWAGRRCRWVGVIVFPPPQWWGRSGGFSPRATVVTRAGGPEGHWPRVAVTAGRRQHHGCSGMAPGTNVHSHFVLTTGVYLSCPTSPEIPEDGCSGVGCSAPRDPVGNGLAPPNPHHHLPPCFPSRSRIACYVTIFQNISNLRDVFYKEMSKVGGQGSTPKHLSAPPQQSRSHPWVLQLHRCQSPTSSPCCPLFNLII